MANFEYTTIEDYSHFVSLTKEFDEKYNTRTYILQDNLRIVSNLIWPYSVHGVLDAEINYCFADKTVLYTNKKNIDPDRMVKMVSFKTMLDSLRKERRFLHPICTHYFPTKKFAIHPGGTRLIFKDIVREPVTTIITDYSGLLQRDHPDARYLECDEVEFDVSELAFLTADNSDGRPRGFTSVCGDEVLRYKELKTTDDDLGMYANGNPHNLDVVYKLELIDETVRVNDTTIINKVDEQWQLVM